MAAGYWLVGEQDKASREFSSVDITVNYTYVRIDNNNPAGEMFLFPFQKVI